jgi:carbon-monoxide dehydrogenase small subunit
MPLRRITLRVNGTTYTGEAEPRKTLADFIREDCGLTGTHLGCEHGVCGACTILMDGQTVRSCLMFAVQAEGADLTTVEGLADGDRLHPIQQAYWDHHALQCGFCTPGFLMTTVEFLNDNPRPTEREIREGLAGNLCRCTGYQNIVKAVAAAAQTLAAARSALGETRGEEWTKGKPIEGRSKRGVRPRLARSRTKVSEEWSQSKPERAGGGSKDFPTPAPRKTRATPTTSHRVRKSEKAPKRRGGPKR